MQTFANIVSWRTDRFTSRRIRCRQILDSISVMRIGLDCAVFYVPANTVQVIWERDSQNILLSAFTECVLHFRWASRSPAANLWHVSVLCLNG